MKPYSLRLVPLVAAVLLTAACSSLNPFASSAVKPAKLVDFTPSAELASTWSANIGDAGPYRFNATLVNCPTRALTGYNWAGQT